MTKVLVVDDDEMIRALLRIILETEGYEVTLAADGNEALQVADWDVMVLDLMMPGISGLDVLDNLPPQSHRHVVILTAFTENPAVKTAKKRGVRLLHKPFDAEVIVRVVEELKGAA